MPTPTQNALLGASRGLNAILKARIAGIQALQERKQQEFENILGERKTKIAEQDARSRSTQSAASLTTAKAKVDPNAGKSPEEIEIKNRALKEIIAKGLDGVPYSTLVAADMEPAHKAEINSLDDLIGSFANRGVTDERFLQTVMMFQLQGGLSQRQQMWTDLLTDIPDIRKGFVVTGFEGATRAEATEVTIELSDKIEMVDKEMKKRMQNGDLTTPSTDWLKIMAFDFLDDEIDAEEGGPNEDALDAELEANHKWLEDRNLFQTDSTTTIRPFGSSAVRP